MFSRFLILCFQGFLVFHVFLYHALHAYSCFSLNFQGFSFSGCFELLLLFSRARKSSFKWLGHSRLFIIMFSMFFEMFFEMFSLCFSCSFTAFHSLLLFRARKSSSRPPASITQRRKLWKTMKDVQKTWNGRDKRRKTHEKHFKKQPLTWNNPSQFQWAFSEAGQLPGAFSCDKNGSLKACVTHRIEEAPGNLLVSQPHHPCQELFRAKKERASLCHVWAPVAFGVDFI